MMAGLSYWKIGNQSNDIYFSGIIVGTQGTTLAGHIGWICIWIDSTRVLASCMDNFRVLPRDWKFYWSFWSLMGSVQLLQGVGSYCSC